MSLLLVLNAKIIPPGIDDHPHLTVQDYDTSEGVSVAMLEAADGDLIQTVAIQYAPLAFVSVGEALVAAGLSSEISCHRFNKIVVRAAFPGSSDTCDIRLIRYDAEYKASVSDTVTITATGVQEESLYLGQEVVFDAYGSSCAIYIDSITGTNVNVWMAAI